mmetsp:Transcript_62195/g.157080  ORF Transcript_62195/g.157080 Transcript_62195/m.157080 type:complete len:200 (-) Transcript_62195:2244-2843(-)
MESLASQACWAGPPPPCRPRNASMPLMVSSPLTRQLLTVPWASAVLIRTASHQTLPCPLPWRPGLVASSPIYLLRLSTAWRTWRELATPPVLVPLLTGAMISSSLQLVPHRALVKSTISGARPPCLACQASTLTCFEHCPATLMVLSQTSLNQVCCLRPLQPDPPHHPARPWMPSCSVGSLLPAQADLPRSTRCARCSL